MVSFVTVDFDWASPFCVFCVCFSWFLGLLLSRTGLVSVRDGNNPKKCRPLNKRMQLDFLPSNSRSQKEHTTLPRSFAWAESLPRLVAVNVNVACFQKRFRLFIKRFKSCWKREQVLPGLRNWQEDLLVPVARQHTHTHTHTQQEQKRQG